MNFIVTKYVKLLNFEYNKLNKNQEYRERLLKLNSIATLYYNCKTVDFIPLFVIKDKRVFTTTGRRFIEIFNINGFEYLAYQILKEHDSKYIESVAYDIQKEMKYKNIIILVDDINRINLNDFAFGLNQILIIEDNEINREKLKYLHSIRWKAIIDKCYKGAYLSEYSFCVEDLEQYIDKEISKILIDIYNTEKFEIAIKDNIMYMKFWISGLFSSPPLERDTFDKKTVYKNYKMLYLIFYLTTKLKEKIL